MAEPAYVSIAGEYARRIRSGQLPAGIQLPSYAEIAEQHGVSDIVVRKAMEILNSQGLVKSIRRRGVFVAERPNLVRISPERQMESAEKSFSNESHQSVQVERETSEISATEALAETFGISTGTKLTHVVTRASEGNKPISISDTYQPQRISGIADAIALEETIADRIPTITHREWLRTAPGDLVKTVHQQFIRADGQIIMISDISYPRDRYDAFIFRMSLNPDTVTPKK